MATINYASTKKSNNMSSKMMRAQMIKTRRSLTYSNSQTMTIYSMLLKADYDDYRRLLLSFGSVDTFQNYINRIHRSPQYSDNVKSSIQDTYLNVL